MGSVRRRQKPREPRLVWRLVLVSASAASELHFSSGSPEETPQLHMRLLPAAALCCLCSALVAMAAQPIQDQLSLTRTVGDAASFSCGGTGGCDYVFWFQKKDTETFRVILRVYSGGSVYSGYNHPQVGDFTAERKQSICELKIKSVKRSHAATYYCYCWNHSEN